MRKSEKLRQKLEKLNLGLNEVVMQGRYALLGHAESGVVYPAPPLSGKSLRLVLT